MANKITVTSVGTTANVNATPDSARYYSDKSKEWAISDRIVDNTDYSSKYYANESKKQADISTAKATEVIESGNTAVSNIASARDNAITDITNQENLSIDNVNTASATQISNVNTAGSTQVANVNSAGTTQINLAKEQVTLATNQANIAKNQATIATNKTSEVVASGNEALSNIDTAKTGALTDITNLKNTSVSNITTAKNNAITSITTQETTSKNNVIATGNEQVERVNLTGVDNRTPIFSKSEIGTNEGVYQNVYDLKHSTFDLSKFTVVGSPTITDDGIASGFSTSNYLQIDDYFVNRNTFKVTLLINTPDPSTQTGTGFTGIIASKSIRGFELVYNQAHKNIQILISSDGSSWDIANRSVLVNILPNSTYIINFEKTATNYYFEAIDTTTGSVVDTVTINNASNITATNGVVYIGVARDLISTENYKGSIDLSQFSITVDGKEVFSGNKTGLDVIKPDNYTVVGSPVISEDGVASGFSASDYLKTIQLSQLKDKSWDIEGTFYHNMSSGNISLLGLTSPYAVRGSVFYDRNSCTFDALVGTTGDMTSEGVKIKLSIPFSEGYYKFRLSFNYDTSTYTLSVYDTNGTLLQTGNYIPPTNNKQLYDININPTTPITIGCRLSGLTSDLPSTDLNAFKIYVDGNLVYQPCLKIPYTESKTGSKIVDVAYRDRVIDLYEQEGQAGYYTIDEPNKNFTLPMGEIYGMMGQRSLISSTVTETNRVDIYSDKTCLICGNVATAGTINLPIELANNNYFITLSTSEKTATSFTTTATGDYILIGKVI